MPKLKHIKNTSVRWTRNVLRFWPIVFILLLFGAFLSGPLVSTGPYSTNIIAQHKPPSKEHWLGTDHLGRDVLSRVLTAGMLDVGIALASAVTAFTVGALLGAIIGYVGGAWDTIVMRFFDVWQSIPGLLFGLLIITVFGKGLAPLIVVISLSFIPLYARMVRAEIAPQRKAPLVEAARLSGVPEYRILLVYLLPRHLTSAIAYLPIQAAYAIGMTASLGFIGLGVKPPAPEWGAMISEGMSNLVFLGIWWTTIPPALCIGLTSLLLFQGGNWLARLFSLENSPRRKKRGDETVATTQLG